MEELKRYIEQQTLDRDNTGRELQNKSSIKKKDVQIKYKLTKEPSLNMNDRLSAEALAHYESKSSIINKGKRRRSRERKTLYRNQKGRATCKSASSVPNENARE